MFRIVLFLLAISFLGMPVNTANAQYPIFLGTGPYRMPIVQPMYTTPSFSSTKTAVRVPGAGTFYVRNQFELDRLMANLERSGRVPHGFGTANGLGTTQGGAQPAGGLLGVPANGPCQPPTGAYNSFFGGYPMQRCYPKIGS